MNSNLQLNLVDNPSLILITGIMAAGKSAVAQHLAERLPKSVHLRGDMFRRMIVSERAEMGLPLSPEAYAQLQLRYQIAAAAAHLYLNAGFTVVYQDIIIGDELAEAIRHYSKHRLYVVVLCPSPDVVARRETGRDKAGYRGFDVDGFDHVFRRETPRLGLWLDSSDLTVSQSVDSILMRLAEAHIPRPRLLSSR